ncbi:PACE efflux transporter [Herbaspirillum sp. GCM10030257]|uniref:PACE efflux transporter n=1 Tax=Herbaspirillum sp. GCM10030257 TaxID=3273393 RepID=UPI00360D29F4
MQGIKRKILYVSIYEAIAIAICSISFAVISGSGLIYSSALSIATSVIAVIWNYLYTTAFEWWESRQTTRGRSVKRRVTHAIGFETGLIIILVPLIAWWLEMTLWRALMMDLGLAAFFLFYTFVFNWVFDRLFGLPASAQS